MENKKRGRPSTNNLRKTEILEKAALCFSSLGYDRTTLDDIGDSLGFNKAALYYYFKNKEDLFGQVMNYERTRLWEISKAEANAANGLENKIIKYFELRSETAIGLIKLNELSKFNLINLNAAYNKAMLTFREKEINFLTTLISDSKTHYSIKEIKDFITLLITVQSNITMSTLLLKELSDLDEVIENLRSRKMRVLKLMLHSFLN